ncbi:MAG: MarR family transcriptional regulator for hemolysin [Myxococcota bacterium]|jgi:MarR family transcriptional regulator for hemolysin
MTEHATAAAAASSAPERRANADVLALRREQSAVQLDSACALRAIKARIEELLVTGAPSDLTAPQANALAILYAAKRPLTARALAEALGVSQVTVSRFVSTLEAKGWVRRATDPDDKRARLISLTNMAYTALPRMVRVSNTVFDEAFAGFTRPEVAQLAGLVARIRANLGA